MVTRYKSPHVLIDLIQRTKAAVRELDNLNYRKMKKILMKDGETESTVDPDGANKNYSESQFDGIAFSRFIFGIFLSSDIPDDQTGGESSKSNSITSEHSVQSIGVSASSQSSSTNSLPPTVDISGGVDPDYSNLPPSRCRPRVRISFIF